MLSVIMNFLQKALDVFYNGIVLGLITSLLFHISLRLMRPKILISETISKYTDNGHVYYRIKVVNTRRRHLINVQFFFETYKHDYVPSGVIVKMNPLEIKTKLPNYFYPYRRRDEHAHYAIRIQLPNNLEEVWPDDYVLQLKIYAVDEFSNSGKLFIQNYYTKDCIKNGVFATRKSMKIEPYQKGGINNQALTRA